MTHIFERVALHCTYAKARQYVHDEGPTLIPRIPAYTLQIEHAEDPLHFDERLKVRWAPKHAALYPEFVGEIVLRMDPLTGSDGAPVLELSGDYLPPFGAPGRAFDLFIGTKIASATAKNVLRTIADSIEHKAL